MRLSALAALRRDREHYVSERPGGQISQHTYFHRLHEEEKSGRKSCQAVRDNVPRKISCILLSISSLCHNSVMLIFNQADPKKCLNCSEVFIFILLYSI